jgi:CheY-like chemotaxis protein
VGRLTGGIAHDFNNLLTAINGFAELMQLRLAPDDPQQEMIGSIFRSGQRAADLVRQLLAFSRKQIIEPKVLNLNAVVADMDKMLRRIIGEDIHLKTRLVSDLKLVKVDPTQLEQVIVNLAVNARDAMPNGGQLMIETTNVVLDESYLTTRLDLPAGEYVLLTMGDTGIGMNEETRAHIFEPFYTTKALGKGTGLGLATVYGIIKQNEGDILVDSNEGAGTTFKIYLPSAQESALPISDTGSMAEMPGGNETILVVEDDGGVRQLIREILRDQGYTLLEAGDGQEALQLVSNHADPIHLLLTDVVMPGISGKILAEKLTEVRSDLKVLYMSGYTDDTIAHHGVLDPGVELIQKPLSPVVLTRKVRDVLDT